MVRTNVIKARPNKRKRTILIAVAVVLGLAAILAVLELTNTTHWLHDSKATSGVIPTNKDRDNDKPAKEDKNTDKNQVPSSDMPQENPKEGDAATQPPAPGTPPLTPTGNFVSNHHPNLGGSPAPSAVQSVCNTTPGAQCYVTFTNSQGVVKNLPAQKTDGSGATYWNWDVKQAGFTAGTWKIKVIATLNGQTRTAEDVQNLEVGP